MNTQNYGFIYNELIVDLSLNIITKKAKHPDGLKKLIKEIQFYRTIGVISPPFYIPKMIIDQPNDEGTGCNNINELKIEYFSDYEPFINGFPYHNDIASVYTIREIIDHITPLHNSISIMANIDEYKAAIKVEVMDKIVERYNSTIWTDVYPEFEQIMYVNNLRVLPLHDYVEAIYKRINYLIDIISVRKTQQTKLGFYRPIGTLTYIHGDIHLGNILVPRYVNQKSNTCIDADTHTDTVREMTSDTVKPVHKYIFIDPRGYFGKYDLYGEPRYDYAKLIFGISGYSIFDQMKVESIDISPVELWIDRLNGRPAEKQLFNINIPFIDDYCHIYDTIRKPDYTVVNPEIDEITILLSLSIWLGNNSTFTSPEKKLTSLMIARYLCERFMR
jgi:hypothetical protein